MSEALERTLVAKDLVEETINGQELIFLPVLKRAEEIVARRIKQLAGSPFVFQVILGLTGSGDVEVGFVDRHLFDGSTGSGNDFHNPDRLLSVGILAGGAHEAAVRAEALGGDAGHGGSDAELCGPRSWPRRPRRAGWGIR